MTFIETRLRKIWRLWSVKLAALAGLVGGFFTAFPEQREAVLNAIPEEWRPLAGVVVGFVIFATATTTRLAVQKPPVDCNKP